MKHLIKTLALGGALATLAPLANATSINATLNMSGTDSVDFTAKKLTFINGPADLATGSINGMTYGAANPVAVTFTTTPISYGSGTTSVNPALAIYTIGGLSFYVTSETPLRAQPRSSGNSTTSWISAAQATLWRMATRRQPAPTT